MIKPLPTWPMIVGGVIMVLAAGTISYFKYDIPQSWGTPLAILFGLIAFPVILYVFLYFRREQAHLAETIRVIEDYADAYLFESNGKPRGRISTHEQAMTALARGERLRPAWAARYKASMTTSL